MITLFVTLVVASVVILFARETVDSAKREMISFKKGEPPKENIIDKGNAEVSVSEIIYLAGECCDRGKQLLQRDLCFLVHGNVANAATNTQILLDYGAQHIPCTPEVEDVHGGKSVAIYFNPEGNKVEIKR